MKRREAGPPAVTAPPYAGAVLAGGRARRFGSDKCAHRYRGRTLLEHALASLEGAEELWIVGEPERRVAGACWTPDERPGFGALGGLHAALRRAGPAWLALIGCDMPFLPPSLWPRLLAQAGEGRLVVPEGPTGLEPLAGVYHRDLAPELDALLDRGGGPLRALIESAGGVVVPWSALRENLPEIAFLNANRPEDLP